VRTPVVAPALVMLAALTVQTFAAPLARVHSPAFARSQSASESGVEKTDSVKVDIDVLSSSSTDRAFRESSEPLKVAILSRDDFDATLVDPDSVRLAGAPVLRTKTGVATYFVEDVDADGRPDLVVEIDARSLFEPDGGFLTLTGATLDGRSIEGSDQIGVDDGSPGRAVAGKLATTFTSGGGITIVSSTSPPTAANPYPSTVAVSGLAGQVISDVNVHLNDLTAPRPFDLDLMLVSPSGVRVTFLSDASSSSPASGVDLVLDDEAASTVPTTPLASGTYRPTNSNATDAFPAPAPNYSTQVALATFDGTNPNGTWSLFVSDDSALGSGGSIASWSLDISTVPAPTPPAFANTAPILINSPIPASETFTPASPYPSTIQVSGAAGSLEDLRVTVDGLHHTDPGDVDLLLVGPTGQSVLLMSDAGNGTDVLGATLTFDDAAPDPLPDQLSPLVSGTYRPTAYAPAEAFPAPAPAAPWGSALGDFDGTNPNGTWSLFALDDFGLDSGVISRGWSLTINPPDCPTATATPTDPSCPGASNGQIAVSVADGLAPFMYSKDDGATFQSSNLFTGLSAGEYQVVVKDAQNCASAPVAITLTDPTFTISPTSNSFGAAGGTGTVDVTVPSLTCAWSVQSNDSWIHVTDVTGNSVAYMVESNSQPNARSGSITIAGETFTVSQAACTPPDATVISGATSVVAGDADSDSPPDGLPGYTYSVPAQAGAGYAWSVSPGGTIESGQGTTAARIVFDHSPGPFTISVLIDNGCGSVTSTLVATKAHDGFSWDFLGTGPAAGWTSEVGVWAQNAGAYENPAHGIGVPTLYESASYGQVYDDFTVEASIVVSRSSANAGAATTLWIRGTPTPLVTGAASRWNSGYAFNIANTGKFSIFKYTPTGNAALQSWVAPVGATIHTDGVTPNVLAVVANGTTMTFSINGVVVKTLTGQTQFPAGKVGVAMVRTSASPEDALRVDYMKLAPRGFALRQKQRREGAAQEAANAEANRLAPAAGPLFDER
jgi:subtilisin-like proprotein convertase family protein